MLLVEKQKGRLSAVLNKVFKFLAMAVVFSWLLYVTVQAQAEMAQNLNLGRFSADTMLCRFKEGHSVT